jgi:endonuclease YncB( thermonuclease family)
MSESNTSITPNIPTLDQILTDYSVSAKVISVYDGDTFTAIFPFPGDSQLIRWKCRVGGIDTPEMITKNVIEKKCAVIAKEYLTRMIMATESINATCKGTDKYGRVIVDFENKSIIDDMIDLGLAKKYSGKTKNRWTDDDFNKIISLKTIDKD